MDWQPTISVENLQKRAAILAQIRKFFAERNILEVETPLLSRATVTDIHLHSLKSYCKNVGELYLQTSPEYAMKRLLAAKSGSIYQICKCFRDDECGRYHNPEFTMLEWYRPGFTHHNLMDEMDLFLQLILQLQPAIRYSYAELFLKYLSINPHLANLQQLRHCASDCGIGQITGIDENDSDIWLQLLLSECIEPQLAKAGVVFIYDYPATQAALAKIRHAEYSVAERFEVYVNGIELANGFHELIDAKEQRERFLCDLQQRQKLRLPKIPIDGNLLAALECGLPQCSGVALGVDRLMMIALNENHINRVVSFPIEKA